MSGNSSQRRKALRAAQREGTRRYMTIPESPAILNALKVDVQPVKPTYPNDAFLADLSILSGDNTPKDVFPDVSERSAPTEPLMKPQSHKEIAEAVIAEACVPNSDSSYADTPPFLRNLEKRSWLWRLWNFVKRIWQ